MYLFLMKFFQNIYDNANKWLDSKLKEVEQQEREFQVFEIQYDEILFSRDGVDIQNTEFVEGEVEAGGMHSPMKS